MTRVLVTGSKGFIGSNLCLRLSERKDIELIEFHREHSLEALESMIFDADFIFHLAGENKPKSLEGFQISNVALTKKICELVLKNKKKIPIVFSSSTQAELDNSYGRSKKEAEDLLASFSVAAENPVAIYRLPGVFGKWSRPNYNSVVSTFCFNIANNKEIEIHDPDSKLLLTYIDDVINLFFQYFDETADKLIFPKIYPKYEVTIQELAVTILAFRDSRQNLISENVGTGLTRALYSTYLSYFTQSQVSYSLESHCDDRGMFVEILKTKESGQFSFFTINPGVTRGQHYHHTKTEKFLVVRGVAKFRFKNLLSKESSEVIASANELMIVESIPGWAHDISNPTDEEVLVMLWANEIFNPENPDTIEYNLDEIK